jgi:hypothetical protein
VSLEAWDANKIDGDMITIVLNGTVIAEKLSLTHEHFKLELPLKTGSNIVEILCTSEGTEQPNTGMISLTTVKGTALATASLAVGQRAKILIDQL